jgi:microtubule-associated protein 1
MKTSNQNREMIVLLASALALAGCAEKKPVSPQGVAIEKTLKAAEKDARAGSEDKALKEIDSAEKALIEEDKTRPYAQQSKTWSGEDTKATADRDAIKELDRARRDAKGKMAGDAADEVKKALKDVETKEGN